MTSLLPRLNKILSARSSKKLLRTLSAPPLATDFSSNNYLSLSSTPSYSSLPTGSTGSRLLSGNHPIHEQLERVISDSHYPNDSDSHALLFNSGYDANLSLASALPQSTDFLLLDEQIHNSIHMGVRMSRVPSENIHTFTHNDVGDFNRKLDEVVAKQTTGAIYAFVEAYYSMSGTVAPLSSLLSSLAALPPTTPHGLIVDEAHSTGVFPAETGLGLLHHHSLATHPSLLAHVHTFGKAYNSHGAVVLSPPATSQTLLPYLINYARPLIYSTSLPPSHTEHLLTLHQHITSPECTPRRRKLFENIRHFTTSFNLHLANSPLTLLDSAAEGPIQSILVPGGAGPTIALSTQLAQHDLKLYPIRYPTVAAGDERLRVIIHAGNTTEEIDLLISSLVAEASLVYKP